MCFGLLDSLVEYLTCVNTVSNIIVLYYYRKHIRFPHTLVLFCCCHLQLRLFLYAQLPFRVPHPVSYIFIYFISFHFISFRFHLSLYII
jgi:hypothetical protein